MSEQTQVSITITESERAIFSQTILESIKSISEASEGTGLNNYPIITQLCELHSVLQKQ